MELTVQEMLRADAAIRLVVGEDRWSVDVLPCEEMFLIADARTHQAWQVHPEKGLIGEQDFQVVSDMIEADHG